MVSVVSSSRLEATLLYLNVNFVQKCQKCQICVIYEISNVLQEIESAAKWIYADKAIVQWLKLFLSGLYFEH